MKRFTFIILLSILVSIPLQDVHSQGAGWQWAQSSGGTGRDEAELPAVDIHGNVTICGKFSDTAWFGTSYLVSSGNLDMYVARYDVSGNFLWASKAGSTQNAEGLSIAAGPNSTVAVTGTFKGSLDFGTQVLPGTASNDNFFVALYDSTGTLLWAEEATGGHIKGKGVGFDPWGNILVTGHYEDSATFGTFTIHSLADQNAFLAKYSPTGTCLWATYGGGQYRAWASSVGVDSHGNSYITGAFKDTADFGTHTIVSYGLNDVFLAKCSPTGSWIWATHAGGANDDFGNGIEVDAYDHIAVTGSFFDTVSFPPAPAIITYGAKDGFVAYYDPNGDCLWVNAFGGTGEDKGIGVSTDAIGNVYVTGFIKGLGNFGPIQKPSAGNDDVCIAKYTRAGQILYADLAGGTANDYGKGIQVGAQGVAYIAGYFEGTTHFGNTTLISKGNRETFVAKYYDGTPLITNQPLSQNLCVGDTLHLSIAIQNPTGITYSWFKNGNLLAGLNSSSIAIPCDDTLVTGKYTAIAQTTTGYVVSDTAYIIAGEYPVVGLNGDTIYWHFGTYKTIVANAGYSVYLWSSGDTTNSISYVGHDLYLIIGNWVNLYVTVTGVAGCQSVDSVYIVFVASVDEPGISTVEVQLLPNPAKDKVEVLCSEMVRRAELIDMRGREILSITIGNHQVESFMIPLTDIPSGVYLIRIFTDKGVAVKKLIKE